MLPASNKGPSTSFGFPDVCLTPVGPLIVPVPYPNVAAHAMAVTFSPIVSVGMLPALNMGSVIAMTTGDEPGVAHWTTKGPGTFDTGNPIVHVDLLPAINLTCLADGNTGNNEPSMVVAPGAPNVLYTYARGEGEDILATLEGPSLVEPGALLAEGVGLLRVRVFSLSLPSLAARAVERMLADGMRALVLDLRDCPGGELLSLVELARDFLRQGSLVVRVWDADGDVVDYRASSDGPYRFPLFVVTNTATASAAELFAGCMKAHGRAVLLGEATHGKDTGQALVPGPNGRAAVTVARLSLPGGVRGRVTPDLEAFGDDALAAATAAARTAARTSLFRSSHGTSPV